MSRITRETTFTNPGSSRLREENLRQIKPYDVTVELYACTRTDIIIQLVCNCYNNMYVQLHVQCTQGFI